MTKQKTEEKVRHAGLPWTRRDDNGTASILGRYEFPPGMPSMGGYPLVATLPDGDTTDANADFILRAVNSHDALVRVLELLNSIREDGASLDAETQLPEAEALSRASFYKREIHTAKEQLEIAIDEANAALALAGKGDK